MDTHERAVRLAADIHNIIGWKDRSYPFDEIVKMIEKELEKIEQ